MGAPKIALEVEIPPAIEFGLAVDVVKPAMPSSHPVETQVPKPPLEREKEVGKKRTRRAVRKSQWMSTTTGLTALVRKWGESPFNNCEVIRGLADGFTIPEVVDGIVDADVNQHAWDSLGSFLKEAFNKGYKLCEEWVANKFSELNLDFLYEGALEEVTDPSVTMIDAPPIEPASATPSTSPAPATIEGLAAAEAASDFSTVPSKV
ncbi:hypothetical protein COCNU_scaffold000135G000010 [Cocos nucifera]|nr:hypothetical protein [Cocos nucifera]